MKAIVIFRDTKSKGDFYASACFSKPKHKKPACAAWSFYTDCEIKNMERKVIVGRWEEKDGQVVANQECRIIQHLIAEHLIKIGQRDGGWTNLYFDPTNGIFWEGTYPMSHMHGGGPPLLRQQSGKSG
jgi:hypothetical protein